MSDMRRLLKTLALLSFSQIVQQVLVVARSKFDRPNGLASASPPPCPKCRWLPLGEFLPPGRQQNGSAEVLQGKFSFLNVSRSLGWPPRWQESGIPIHWHYNLHYLDYIWVLDYEQARELACNWMDNNPIEKLGEGWHAYPISLRVVNLVAFFWGRHSHRISEDVGFQSRLWSSIWRQCEWLRRHMETNVGGNHLVENAAALSVAGCCFEGDAALRWLDQGCWVLNREVPIQILADGAHIARSPMYQCRMVYVFATLLNTGEPKISDIVREPLNRMARELVLTCHPDGDIALLNDSACGVYNHPAQLSNYVMKRLAVASSSFELSGSFLLKDAGFAGCRDARGNFLIVDFGPSNAKFIPGHGHGGMLSYELSFAGSRCVTDSGAGSYVAGRLRDHCKSTRAHSTVEVNAVDQNEYWDVFRVASIGHVRGLVYQEEKDGFSISASHDGYRRLPSTTIHERELRWMQTGVLMVRDRVVSRMPVPAVTRIQIHPSFRVVLSGDKKADISNGNVSITAHFSGNGRLAIESSSYSPEFGLKEERAVLAFHLQDGVPDATVAYCLALTDSAVSEFDSLRGLIFSDGRSITWPEIGKV